MSAVIGSSTVVRLAGTRDVPASGSAGLAGLLAAVRAVPVERATGPASRPAPTRTAPTRTEPTRTEPARTEPARTGLRQEELVAADLALAGESATLRARAARYAAAREAGAAVDGDAVEAVRRALRSYEPFLGARDRRLNAAAHRLLAGATPLRRAA